MGLARGMKPAVGIMGTNGEIYPRGEPWDGIQLRKLPEPPAMCIDNTGKTSNDWFCSSDFKDWLYIR